MTERDQQYLQARLDALYALSDDKTIQELVWVLQQIINDKVDRSPIGFQKEIKS